MSDTHHSMPETGGQSPQLPVHHHPLHSGTMMHMEELFDFRRIYYLLLKRLWIIAVIVVLGMVAVVSYVIRMPSIYESRAVLQVDLKEKKILNTDDIVQESGGTPDYINTIAQDIQSKNVLLRTVKANNLQTNPAFAPQKAGGKPYTDDQLAGLLSAKLQISIRRLTRLINITAYDTDPVMARDLASALMKEFFRESFEQRMSVNRVASEFLAEEAEKLKKKLEQSEQNLQRYKEENDAVSLEQNQNIIVTKLQELNTAVTTAKNVRLRLESDIDQLKKSPPGDPDALLRISSVAELPQVNAARQALLAAEGDFGPLKEHYLSKHPKYIAAVNRIDTLRQALREATAKAGEVLAQQYESALQTENKLTDSLKEQEAKALELGKLSIPYNVLSREVETDRAMYASVVSRMKETSVAAGVESAPFHVIEEPMIPSVPTLPQRKRIVALWFLLLTAGSSAAIVIVDLMGTGLRTVDEAESVLGLPVLGSIPDQRPTPGERQGYFLFRKKGSSPDRKGELRVSENSIGSSTSPNIKQKPERYSLSLLCDPSSPLSESYRTLRANITLSGTKESTQVLMFTSAIPEEGKTFSSMNCAVSFAQQGEKTLLIDGDLRRPSIHHALLNGQTAPGLSDYLIGEKILDDILLPVPNVSGLHILTAGSRSPNPAELLGTSDLTGLIETLRSQFDRIIIDTAPVNAVADTLLLSVAASRVILVVRAEKTPRKAIHRSIKLLRKTGTTVLGIALNRLSRGSSAGYYYYYYGDKYLKDSVYGSSGLEKQTPS